VVDEDSAKFIMFKIATGVKHLHSKKIVHRDLKLENILLRQNQMYELVDIKIVDFGLST